jgi:hypothetical protein
MPILKHMRRRFLKYTCVFLLILVCFRGPIYRSCFRYELIGERPLIPISKHNIGVLTIQAAQNKAAAQLYFVFDRAETNPNKLLNADTPQAANCIGYAALTASLLSSGQPNLRVRHRVAKIYFLGQNIHAKFSSPFFKDHDVVEVTDSASQKTVLLDPVLYDYGWIGEVRL